MTLEQKIARLLKMDEKARRRHTNPWSVYSRISVTPLLGLAFWSRVWLGWWSLAPIIVALSWLWFNPRIFPEPVSTNNWASKVVLGEWVWMNRKKAPVPERHRHLPNILSAVEGIGAIFFIWGLAVLDVWPVAFGGAVIIISKLWFADRMVWLYEDTKPDRGDKP